MTMRIGISGSWRVHDGQGTVQKMDLGEERQGQGGGGWRVWMCWVFPHSRGEY